MSYFNETMLINVAYDDHEKFWETEKRRMSSYLKNCPA